MLFAAGGGVAVGLGWHAALDQLLAQARAGGGEKSVARHHQRGKLLVRERIELLVDQDSPFLELSPFAAAGTDYEVGAAVVCGLGVVSGVECYISGNDPPVPSGQPKATQEIVA